MKSPDLLKVFFLTIMVYCLTSISTEYFLATSNDQKKQRGRKSYGAEQLKKLEEAFHTNNHFINKGGRDKLQELLKGALSDRQIKIWFQNRRMKLKKEQKEWDDQRKDPSWTEEELKERQMPCQCLKPAPKRNPPMPYWPYADPTYGHQMAAAAYNYNYYHSQAVPTQACLNYGYHFGSWPSQNSAMAINQSGASSSAANNS